jgi:hypothetical protein
MTSPPNTKSPAALTNFIFRQLPDDVVDEIGAHYGGAYHQKAAGASGVPDESVTAVVGGGALAEGQDTVTIGLVQNFAEDRGRYSIIVGGATFEASAQAPEAGGVDAAAYTFMTASGADYILKFESSDGRACRPH